MSNELEKAIRYFKNMRDDNKVVLDSGFGMKKGENNLLYKNRKKYAELAIEALEKQMGKKPKKIEVEGYRYTDTYRCPTCEGNFSGTGIADYCYHCGQKLDWSVEDEQKAT